MNHERRNPPSNSERWAAAEAALAARKEGPHGLTRHAATSIWPLATLRRWARVAERYPPRDRDLPNLSFSHYECVAAHPKRMDLLRDAASNKCSVQDLRLKAASTPSIGFELKIFGPQTLDSAIDYCLRLSRFEPKARASMRRAVLPRVQTLADMAGSLASDWDANDAS
jgi:hypothetical protein